MDKETETAATHYVRLGRGSESNREASGFRVSKDLGREIGRGLTR